MLAQPTVEKISDNTIHTARLVPLYTRLSESLKIGSLRRILKGITDGLQPVDDSVAAALPGQYPDLISALKTLHFPDDPYSVAAARERLALEELLGIIEHSHSLKHQWQQQHTAHPVSLTSYDENNFSAWLPTSIPFELTRAQQRVTREILADLRQNTPMNRLLVGDVGSGKTVVAGIACSFVLQDRRHAVLAAPTQILAQQHAHTLAALFPEISIQLITAKESARFTVPKKPTLFIGTHAILNKLTELQPALIIYDEQHRFGVKQRSPFLSNTDALKNHKTPHVLTLSATPIPRSLMLTLFSHLQLSVIDELPTGRQLPETWLVPNQKRSDSLQWLSKTLHETGGQALIVCPFIEPSVSETLGNVAAANELHKKLTAFYKEHAPALRVGLLHGKLSAAAKQKTISQLFAKEIDVLVSTPVVEVGVDLPAANIILIEAAERFGLASLHQLRGRVGRAGQASYCLLFTNATSPTAVQRLKTFTEEHDGLKLAEQDLEQRGAGDLFGFRQHGFTDLRFASWTNLQLIRDAHQVFQTLRTHSTWHPFIPAAVSNELPAAN
jgi:ATP-dependent DNA helicase RecG